MAARTRATCRALMHVRVSTNGALALPRWGTGESLGGRLHPQPDPQPPVRSPVVGVVLYVRSVKPACIPARCYPGRGCARATGRLRGQPPRRAERCPIRASESMLDLTFISAHARHTTSVPFPREVPGPVGIPNCIQHVHDMTHVVSFFRIFAQHVFRL